MELMIMHKSTFIKLFNRIGKWAKGTKSWVCTLVLTMQLSHFLPVTFSLHRHWPVSLLHTSDMEPLAWHWHAVRKKQNKNSTSEVSYHQWVWTPEQTQYQPWISINRGRNGLSSQTCRADKSPDVFSCLFSTYFDSHASTLLTKKVPLVWLLHINVALFNQL